MLPNLLITIPLLIIGCAELFLAGIALRRRAVLTFATRWLILYLTLSSFWMFGFAAYEREWLTFITLEQRDQSFLYINLLLAVLFLYLNRTFLKAEPTQKRWGINWMLAILILDLILLLSLTFARPYLNLSSYTWKLLLLIIIVSSWSLFTTRAAIITSQAFRQTKYQPLHRNRIAYWVIALFFAIASHAFIFFGRYAEGAFLHFPVSLLISYSLLTHKLFDVRQLSRRIIVYVAVTLLTLFVYVVGMSLSVQFYQSTQGATGSISTNDVLIIGAFVALILSLLYNSLFGLVQQIVNRLIFGIRYDHNLTLKEYTQQISQILDLNQLSEAIMDTIKEAMDIREGNLILTYQKGDGQHPYYQLRTMGKQVNLPWIIDETSPILHYFCNNKDPLTQYDIDLLPNFSEINPEEQNWFKELDAEVYIPIYTQDNWTGLLALGPKKSNNPYYDTDLILLSTLADQTGIALQNARLVDEMRKANHDLQLAYADIEDVNKQLQKSDDLKSSFLGVISHELRTPFSTIGFSLQLLQKEGLSKLSTDQQEQFQQLAEASAAAKSMVDNLVTFASFFNKQGELRLTNVDFTELVELVVQSLEPIAHTKDIHIDLSIEAGLLSINGDRDRLQDMIHHLIHNAIKFTDADGHIFIKCWDDGDSLYFEIQDTGIGIPEDRLPSLWEGFNQMADPLKRGVEGLGLGLRLIKYVADAHEGEIRTHSELGVGTEFAVRLPLAGPQKN